MRGMAAVMVTVAAMLFGGCTVPGDAYAYVDVRIGGAVQSSTAWPAAGQTFTLSVPVRSAWTDALTVSWTIYRDPADPALPTAGTPVASGSLTVSAKAAATLSASIAGEPAGPHTYHIVLDPGATIAERFENNNVAVLALGSSDAEIAYGSTSPSATLPVPAGPELHLGFSLVNTANPAASVPPAANIGFTVLVDGATTPTAPLAIQYGDPLTAAGATVPVPSGAIVPVRIVMPNPGPGTHTYEIEFSADVPERSTTDNAVIVITTAGG